MKERLGKLLEELSLLDGLPGHEQIDLEEKRTPPPELRGCAKTTYQSMAKLFQLKLIGFVR